MSDGLSAENYGCNTLTAEEECVSSKDGRPAFGLSPCQWCCGEACTSGGSKCEPKGWLVDQDDYIGHSKSGLGDDNCPVLNIQTSGCYTIGDAETCVRSKDGRAAFGASPCQWCCGAACTSAGAKCEPKEWLFKQDDYIGLSRNGFSENTCLKMEGGCVRHPDGCVTSTGFNETTEAAGTAPTTPRRTQHRRRGSWHLDHLDGDACRFSMPASPLVVKYFHTDSHYDTLKVNGVRYHGTLGPSGAVPVGDVVWKTHDNTRWGRGFRICPLVDAGVDLGSDFTTTQSTTTRVTQDYHNWYSHGWAR